MIRKILAAMLALFAAVAFAATDVNTATQAELESVKGIGPAISAKILDARKSGPFKDWGDLVTRVKGIGDKNGAEFSAAGLTVNGAAKSGAPADPSAVRKGDKTGGKTTAKNTAPAAAATPAAATPATPSATPPATPTTAATTASAPLSAADKKAAAKAERDAKKAAKAEAKARKKAANADGAASSASAPAKK